MATNGFFRERPGPMPDNIETLMWDAWHRLWQLGVDHGDEREPNLLWNAELQQPMCIDFDCAKMVRDGEAEAWGKRSRARCPGGIGWRAGRAEGV